MNVYSEKDIFEEIILFNQDYPNWYNIFCNHAEICLNISDEDLTNEFQEGKPIFEYVKINGARKLNAVIDYFTAFLDNNSLMIEHPRAVFFLNCNDELAKSIKSKYGLIVQTPKSIDDNILGGTYYKNLTANTVCDIENKMGWSYLLNNKIPPLNSIVMSDNFLFSNDNGNRGSANFIQFIQAVLPDTLAIDFHILIIAQEHKDQDKAWCVKKAGDLKTALNNLKMPYDINFEIVFAETIHKRIAISNYFTITPDKGFAVFKTNDMKIVHEDTEIQLDKVFNRINKSEGDTEYDNASHSLKNIKKICTSVAQYITQRPDDKNFRILADCNPDHSIRNRLINDV